VFVSLKENKVLLLSPTVQTTRPSIVLALINLLIKVLKVWRKLLKAFESSDSLSDLIKPKESLRKFTATAVLGIMLPVINLLVRQLLFAYIIRLTSLD
jgi:hypothetical protein